MAEVLAQADTDFNPSLPRFRPVRAPLPTDVAEVLAIQDTIFSNNKIKNFDQERILGIVSAGPGSEALLMGSIPHLIGQIHQCGQAATILIGLNHGTTINERDLKKAIKPVRGNRDLKTSHLWNSLKTKPDDRARTFDSPKLTQLSTLSNLPSEGNGVHIIFVHQGEHEQGFTAGKGRMLAELTRLILDSVTEKWQMPAHTLLFDAETYLYLSEPDGKPDLTSNGLARLLYELDAKSEDLDLVGSKWRMTPYEQKGKIDRPTFQPINPIVELFQTHFGTHFNWLSGGGTLGRSEIITPLLHVITKYPGVRMEDLLLTVLAEACGFKWRTITEVKNTNRCFPAGHERAEEQPHRWFQGIYGAHLYGDTANECHDTAQLLAELPPEAPVTDRVFELVNYSFATPDDNFSGTAAWNSDRRAFNPKASNPK